MNLNLNSHLHSHLREAVANTLKQRSSEMGTLAVDNPIFKAFAFYTTVLILKMIMVTFRVTFLRLTKHVYVVPEDVKAFSPNPHGRPIEDDEDVERARKCQRNNLENIPIFIFLGLLLVLTGSNYTNAVMHFRVFTLARILYTICYLFAVPAPSRTLCFTVGTLVNVSMVVQVLMATIY